MFHKLIVATLLVATGATCGGCGRVMHGKTQSVGITSMPEGATVMIEPGNLTAVTPAKFELKRGSSYKVVFAKEGYQSVTASISKHLSRWTYGNLMFPSVFAMVAGFATDRKTGGAYRLEPKEMNVTLAQTGKAVASAPITSAIP